MKTISLALVSFFISFSVFLNAQIINGEASYHIAMIHDLQLGEEDELIQPVFDRMRRDSEDNMDVLFRFIFDEDKTLFYYEDPGGLKELTLNLPLIQAQTAGKFYTDLKTGEVLNEKVFKEEVYVIKTNINDHKWTLKDETKKIGQYLCHKAFLKREFVSKKTGELKQIIFEAWYTKEIEISSGPMGFGGLPGLIVQLQHGDIFVYYLSQFSEGLSTAPQIEKPEGTPQISKEEYAKIVYENSIFSKMKKETAEPRDTSSWIHLMNQMFRNTN